MKQILTLLISILMSCTIAFSQSTNANDSATSKSKGTQSAATYTPTYTDTDDEGVTVESIMEDGETVESTVIDEEAATTKIIDKISYTFDSDDFGFLEGIHKVAAGSIIFIIFFIFLVIFALPLLIVLLILYFRNRNRREQYRVVEKAIEAGQPIPNEILKENLKADTEAKGINKMCLGVGLFIFLWFITSSLGIGCIGVLVGFIGLGQYLVGRQSKQFTEEATLKEMQNRSTNANGIKNMCLGVGLFFFLWQITHSLALGCLGVLIFFIGLGQYLATYNTCSKRNNKDNCE